MSALTSIVITTSLNSGVQVLTASNYTQIIVNARTNPLNVWPQFGMALYPAAANTAVSLAPGQTLGLIVANATQAYAVFTTSSFG